MPSRERAGPCRISYELRSFMMREIRDAVAELLA